VEIVVVKEKYMKKRVYERVFHQNYLSVLLKEVTYAAFSQT
jgi:hypothetical protein